MTTSERFPYDPLKWDFIAFKVNSISVRKCIVDTDVVNDDTCTRQCVITRVVLRLLWHDVITIILDKLSHTIQSLDGRTAPRTAAMDTLRLGSEGTSSGEWEHNNNYSEWWHKLIASNKQYFGS